MVPTQNLHVEKNSNVPPGSDIYKTGFPAGTVPIDRLKEGRLPSILHTCPRSVSNATDRAQSSWVALFGFDLGFTTNLPTQKGKVQVLKPSKSPNPVKSKPIQLAV